MTTIREALDALLPAFAPLGSERVILSDALGRVLAVDVMARSDMPAFDNSAMDGYAVRSADLWGASDTTPISLPVRGESRAGGGAPDELAPAATCRIFTGAIVPGGADAIVMQEEVARGPSGATFKSRPQAGAHVRKRASDLRAGARLVAAGSVIGPGEMCAAAAQGFAVLAVHRRPRVAILSTGDELRDLGEPTGPGDVVNCNAYMLAAQVREAGGDPWLLPAVPDRADELRARIREGLRADLLLSCGGVSVGEYDLVKEAFEAEGVTLGFWKVAMKPGKPLAFGIAPAGTPVLGLPGNPVSAFVTFEVFVRPGLRRMVGDPRPFRPVIDVRLDGDHRRSPGRTELARATLRLHEGNARARLTAQQGSGSIPGLVGVHALVELPADASVLADGTTLRAMVLDPDWAKSGCSAP